MNMTSNKVGGFLTLVVLLQHLGRTKKAIIDETEKGWYITWVEKSEEQLEWEAKQKKKNKMVMNDEELTQKYVNRQIEKAKAEVGSDQEEETEATELIKGDNETVKLDLVMKSSLLSAKPDTKVGIKSVFKEASLKEREGGDKKKDDTKTFGQLESKRKMSALEEIMEQGKKKQKQEEAKKPKARSWLRHGIVVKVVTKSLGDKYYKKKGRVKEVIDDFAALVVMTDTGAKVKLDQDHLETVVPGEGREVVVLWGEHVGEVAALRTIDTASFSASLRLLTGQQAGEKLKLPYEQFSKKWEAK
jgi:DNA/RNA-binding protein KIN17